MLGQPAAISHSLSVDRIHGILRSAEAGECQDLFSVYRDILLGHAHTQTVYNQRKLACLTKALTISPADPKSADDLAATPVPAGGLQVISVGVAEPVAAVAEPEALAGRIEDCDSRIVLTSDEGLRGGKKPPFPELVVHYAALRTERSSVSEGEAHV